MINHTVLMSGAEEFAVKELNPYSYAQNQPDRSLAAAELTAIQAALEEAGINVERVEAPPGCQDGVYTANWALVHNGKAILSNLPGPRKKEEPYARKVLKERGLEVIEPLFRFSGQGDALIVGNTVFCGQTYRTHPRMHAFIEKKLGLGVISLETVPLLSPAGRQLINVQTDWPDSYFYDIDLALAVLRPDLIAWCPEAFTPRSREILRRLADFDTIEVSYEEAVHGFACNLVSSGETVVMSALAPKLQAAIESHGLRTITPEITELAKGGGYIRCTSLTLRQS